jgi:homoserine O-succinyltransferase
MPLIIDRNLPAYDDLKNEGVFVMDEERAKSQEIRPLEIGFLNLMPNKETTETQFLRAIAGGALQVRPTFIKPATHVSKTESDHLKQFYLGANHLYDTSLPREQRKRFDGMIITGAPFAGKELEDIDFYPELQRIMRWSRRFVTSTLFSCWAAQIALHEFYGVNTQKMPEKISGVFEHTRGECKKLLRGMDEVFQAPHSRTRDVPLEELAKHPEIKILSQSPEVGAYLMANQSRSEVYVLGHPEYDLNTLKAEYERDVARGINPKIPKNYFPDNDPTKSPRMTWQANGHTFLQNWINHVYQATPFDLWNPPEKGAGI